MYFQHNLSVAVLPVKACISGVSKVREGDSPQINGLAPKNVGTNGGRSPLFGKMVAFVLNVPSSVDTTPCFSEILIPHLKSET